MKTGVFIINAARGKIVNEDALLEALNTGKVAGAALDVFSTEPPGKTALITHPKIIATPHIGGQTKESLEQTGIDIVEEVLAALEGKPLRWRII
jgi:D-3-phosphoglycerate dehydrogenase